MTAKGFLMPRRARAVLVVSMVCVSLSGLTPAAFARGENALPPGAANAFFAVDLAIDGGVAASTVTFERNSGPDVSIDAGALGGPCAS